MGTWPSLMSTSQSFTTKSVFNLFGSSSKLNKNCAMLALIHSLPSSYTKSIFLLASSCIQ